MNDIIKMVDRIRDNSRWTPEQMLEDALHEVRTGARTPNRAVVLFLEDEGEEYAVGYTLCNIQCSQTISLIEVVKTMMLKEMGFIDRIDP